MRFTRLAAIAGASVLVLGVASCSSTGGKPQESAGGMGAGQANTPRVTVAMGEDVALLIASWQSS
jgi:simple sugar transport system substrate-binding protein